MQKMKYFITFALLLFIAVSYKTYEQYNRIQNTKELIVKNESQSLANFITAFRQTYQDVFLRNHIDIDEKTMNLLPVKTIAEINNRFSSSVQSDIVIRTVSDRPRNANNLANSFEMEMIRYFQEHPDDKQRFLQKEGTFYYTQPLRIQQSCLQCHGKREDAIPSVRDKYDQAYDYKLGDIRGLLNIKIKERGFFAALYTDFIDTLLITAMLYVLSLFVIYLLIKKIHAKEKKYTQELEADIKNKVDEIEEQRKYLQSIIDGVEDPIMVIGEDYTIHLMNSSIRQKLNTSVVADPDHPKCYEILHHRSTPCDGHEYPCPLQDVMESKNNMTVVHSHRGLDGNKHYMELSVSPLFDKEKNCRGVIEVARDITTHLEIQDELREQKISLDFQAHHDALTGLPNRIYFNDRLHQGIENARRHGTMLALFFIDLDQFKHINDSLGHEIGDRVLQVVADRLRARIRKEDTLARLGGDEFTIIMEELKRVQDASLLAQKILKVLREAIHIEDHMLYITCSIGISLYPQDDLNAHNLLKYADTAMYKAKEEGRNSFQFYSAEMTKQAFERIVMKTSLRQALDNEELVVYYQPQVDVNTGKLTGMEALVRWRHPTRGLVSPSEFIPLAEETELIIEIDQWVMRIAMQQVKEWYQEGLEPGMLALNFEMKQLDHDDFIQILQKSMADIGFRPEWLELEVAEGKLMQKPEEAIVKLRQISDIGIQIVIDNFGTGYSSLAYLKRLPVHKLKIDRAFIREIPEDEESAAIVKAIIVLAKSLNLDIVAEGVETEVQKEFLFHNGCKKIQGYYHGQPKPAEEIEKMLKK